MSRNPELPTRTASGEEPASGWPERLGAEVILRDGSLGRLVGCHGNRWIARRDDHLPRRFLIPEASPGRWDPIHRQWHLDMTVIEAIAWPDPGPHEPVIRTLVRLGSIPMWFPAVIAIRLWRRRRRAFQASLLETFRSR
jgi:hypothetical protein